MENKILNKIVKYKKVNFDKLEKFGFDKSNDTFIYQTDIVDEQFRLIVTINGQGQIETDVIEKETQEKYTLFLIEGIEGSFVGRVREEYLEVLENIVDKCFEKEIFKSNTTKEVINFVKNKFGDELEFLWEKTPDCAIWRRKDSNKWYGAILTIPMNKLGFKGTENIEILDLHLAQDKVEEIIDNDKFFPGYHMNKKHWITICLDGKIPIEQIQELIEESYSLAKK